MFETGTLVGFKGAVSRWLLPRVVFSSVFCGACALGFTGMAHGVAKAIYKQLRFSNWVCAAGFNNNNNNNNNKKV